MNKPITKQEIEDAIMIRWQDQQDKQSEANAEAFFENCPELDYDDPRDND